MNDGGFVKLQRSDATRELLRDLIALHLMINIGYRARYNNEPSLAGLSYGQAFVGDWDVIGLTRAQARAAMKRLTRWGLVRFEGTPAGTIATLLDSRVFSLRDERGNGKRGQRNNQPVSEEKINGHDHPCDQPTTNQRPACDQPTTTNTAGKHSEHSEHGQTQSLFPSVTAEEIYAAYPKKVGRQAALKAIAKAIESIAPERLLERTRAYAQAVAQWDADARQYVPYPSTWFNRGSFDDDPGAWIRTNARPGQRDSHNADTPKF
jgi:hypothetical protein